MSAAQNAPGWAQLDGTEGALVMFCVYAFPLDYPRHWVVRRLFVLPNGEQGADVVPRLALTVDEAREQVPPGLYCQPRYRGDEDPHLLEVWF